MHPRGLRPRPRYGVNYEDVYYEQALSDTFRLALDRMLAEATALGAHGVVGVRHTLSDLQVASSAPVIELKMVGTAIVRPGAAPLEQPFTSHLSGQEFAKLLDTGRCRRASSTEWARSGHRVAASG